jgi:ABC-type polysaccharide/polyol phosphate export permease
MAQAATPTFVFVPSHRRSLLQLLREAGTEVFGRSRLIRYMVAATMKRTHANTLLGQLWWILDPLFTMAIYVVLVQIIFNVDIPDYPLFIFAAILPWKWFDMALSTGAGAVTAREGLIRQIQFPKIVLPVAGVLAATVSFAISLIALGLVYIFFLDRLSWWVLALPLIAAVQFAFALALAIGLAAANTFYRDVQNLLRHVARLWFYASPGLWSLDEHVLDEGLLRTILSLNPMAWVLESYRNIIWGTAAGDPAGPEFMGLLYTLVVAMVLLIVSIAVFKRTEPAFAKVI